MIPMLLLAATAAGVPPGYVDDRSCLSCHNKIAQPYRQVGMSKSFYRPRPDDVIEDFSKLPFHHALSGDIIDLRWRDGRLVFRRWRLDAAGKPDHLFEQPVDWILGSGHHARVYLYQTPNGELYQLPIAWYSQEKAWGMAPGFDRRDHEGVTRRARLECLFCHNAYSNLAEDSRNGYWRSQGLPRQLPEGIGCQRCHGPGAEHVAKATAGADDAALKATIVRPSHLDARLRNDVCYECHMQPSVAIPGIRRFDRDIDSFRPGQPLPSYRLDVEITDAGIPRPDRFEINHHPYRLEQSRCFRESQGRLSCLSCHDPHRKVPPAERAAHYREVCAGCHTAAHAGKAGFDDCVTCHMPSRRTQDVVHVVMTDHRIARAPAGDLLSPRKERDPIIEEMELFDRARAPADAELYRVVAAARTGSSSAARRLEALLQSNPSSSLEPYLDLAAAQLRQKRYDDVEKTSRLILARAPDHPLALEWLGVARANLGFQDEAIDLLRKASTLDPQRVETHFNLGIFLAGRQRYGEAAASFERALAGRPNFVLAWIRLGEAREAEGKIVAAIEAYRRALEIGPDSARAKARLEGVVRSEAGPPHP